MRSGVGAMPRLRGMNTEDDPGSVPPDQFRLLQNLRSNGQFWVGRGGQAKRGAAVTGVVMGIFPEDSTLPEDA